LIDDTRIEDRVAWSHENNAKVYNLRSNASKNFSAKLAKVFIKSKAKRYLGSSYYEIADESGKVLSTYH